MRGGSKKAGISYCKGRLHLIDLLAGRTRSLEFPERNTVIMLHPWFLVRLCLLLLLLHGPVSTRANNEGDALHALRQALDDPSQVLQSWDPSFIDPCTWFHITCNLENKVVRVDLGDAMLSGSLVPQLGQLSELQYLEMYSNNISGTIPKELGNLSNLVSLDLYQNRFSGPIPEELGNLQNLRFLRLNNNSLTGEIPMSLTQISDLQVLDLSYNNLSGEVPTNGSFALFTPISFEGNPNLCGAAVGKLCPNGTALTPAPTPTPC